MRSTGFLFSFFPHLLFIEKNLAKFNQSIENFAKFTIFKNPKFAFSKNSEISPESKNKNTAE
jgi:hypothetical protein